MLNFSFIKKHKNIKTIVNMIICLLILFFITALGKDLYVYIEIFLNKQILEIMSSIVISIWSITLILTVNPAITNFRKTTKIKKVISNLKSKINITSFFFSISSLIVLCLLTYIKLYSILKINVFDTLVLSEFITINYECRDLTMSIKSWWKSWEYSTLNLERNVSEDIIIRSFWTKVRWRAEIVKISKETIPFIFLESNNYNFPNPILFKQVELVYKENLTNDILPFPTFKFSHIIPAFSFNNAGFTIKNIFIYLKITINWIFYSILEYTDRSYESIINLYGFSNISYKESSTHNERLAYLEKDMFNLDFFMYNYISTSKELNLFETSSTSFLNFLIIYLIKNIFLDGVSLWLLWLVLIVGYVLSFSKNKKKIINNNIFKKNFIYNNLLNFIIFLMIICFLSKDLFIFFIAFESILFPLFLYIILQGSRLNKIYAVKYLVIYTIVGSVFLWYGISYIVEILGVSNFDHIKWTLLNSVSSGTRIILFLSFFIGFAFKIPMVPFHHWLIIAHVEAPTNGSIILAALLLKVGGYGLYRFVYNLFPLEVLQFSNEIIALAVFGFTYSTMLAVRQIDIKRYIAYTSIAHMNYSLIGLFSGTEIGLVGYIHIMISHGIISTAMFYIIGHLYSILHFRDTVRISGIAYIFPKLSAFLFLFSIANMGIPLFSGFPGEFFIFIALVSLNEYFAILIFFGFMFSGIYNFLQINKLLFSGYSSDICIKKNNDIDSISFLILTILLLWSLIFGLLPDIITKNVEIGINL